MIHYTVGETSLGRVLVARTEAGVCAILLGDDREELERDLRTRFPGEELRAENGKTGEPILSALENPAAAADLSLDLGGTPFERRVWDALRQIPPGETITYGELARRIGNPRATRAVARACGANPVAVVVPCHRVVRADGSLSGYRWGVERKRALLERERQAAGRS